MGRPPWRALLLEQVARRARAACGLLEGALADCQADLAEERVRAEESRKTAAARAAAAHKVEDKFAGPLERLDQALALLRRVEALAAGGAWEPLYDLLTPYVLGMEPEPGLKGMKTRLAGARKAAVRTRAAEAAGLFGEILDLIPCSEAEAEEDRALAAPRLAALFRAVRDFDARFAARKRERKLLEFSDFEHLALRLLRGPDGAPTALCEGIRAGYGAVMVDEYQDTNALQDALYTCLAAPDGGNLFLVGGPQAEHLPLPPGRPRHLPGKAGALAPSARGPGPSPRPGRGGAPKRPAGPGRQLPFGPGGGGGGSTFSLNS